MTPAPTVPHRPGGLLAELPAPPPGRTGWPWTEQSAPMPAAMPDGRPWPKISLVTPSFRHAQYIEETIRSVLLQNYPNLEYFVEDGGSTDGTATILEKYSPWLSGWVSEKDRGQSHAINKGFARCTGEIANWLCSDDTLTPGALDRVSREFAADPGLDVVAGACRMHYPHDPARDVVARADPKRVRLMPCCNPVYQPACFFRPDRAGRESVVDESLHYALDFELWNRLLAAGTRWRFVGDVLAVFRMDGQNKTSTGAARIEDELRRVYLRYTAEPIPLTVWYTRLLLPLAAARHGTVGIRRRLASAALVAAMLALSPFYGADRVRALDWYWTRLG
jgi:glycosyltransferase involved in cell wall biosynthesis